MEFYPESFFSYVHKLKDQHYKNVDLSVYVQQVLSPIVIHSLAHEFVHALGKVDDKKLKLHGWSWEEKSVENRYLKNYRLPEKMIQFIKENTTFRGKNKQQWLELKDQFEQEFQTYILDE